MTQIMIDEQSLKKIDHLEKMVYSIFEEIKKIKFTFVSEKLLSLRGILKGVKISEKEIVKAKKSLFREIEI